MGTPEPLPKSRYKRQYKKNGIEVASRVEVIVRYATNADGVKYWWELKYHNEGKIDVFKGNRLYDWPSDALADAATASANVYEDWEDIPQ